MYGMDSCGVTFVFAIISLGFFLYNISERNSPHVAQRLALRALNAIEFQ